MYLDWIVRVHNTLRTMIETSKEKNTYFRFVSFNDYSISQFLLLYISMNRVVLICHGTWSVFVSTSSFDFFKYLLNSIGFTIKLTRIKENTKVTKRALYS